MRENDFYIFFPSDLEIRIVYGFPISRKSDARDGRTDRQTDRKTDGVQHLMRTLKRAA